MTVTEAADKYKYSRRTLLDAITRRALPAQRAGHIYLIDETEMERYTQRTGHKVGRPRGKPRRPASEETP